MRTSLAERILPCPHFTAPFQAIEKRALAVKQQLADQDKSGKKGGDDTPFPHSVDIFLKKHFTDPSHTMQNVLEDTLVSTFGVSCFVYIL